MIKEKEVYSFPGIANKLEGGSLSNPQNRINAESVQKLWEEYIAQHNIPAVISGDTYSYKTGLFKSDTAQCVVVSHSDEPKKFRKMVMVIKQVNGRAELFSRWYEQSEVDRLMEKSQEADKKAQKARNKADKSEDASGMLAGTASLMMQNMKNKKIAKKVDARKDIESDFHDSLVNAVVNIYDRIRELVQ